LSGDPDRAQTELEAALRLAPASIPVRALLADISLSKRDYSSSLRYSDEILKAQPGNGPARLVRSASLLGLGRYQELQPELEKLLAAQPHSADAQFQYGSLNLAEGRPKDAEDAFRKAWEAKPGDVRALEGVVEAEIAQDQSDKALRLIEQEIAKTPDSTALRGILAATALRTGHADIAIEQYKRLISENPRAGVLYFGLGEALRSRREYPEALAQFENATRSEPGNLRFEVAVAGTESLMGHKDDARNSFRKALAMQPDDPTVMNDLAYLIAETGGSLPEARKLAQAAVRKQPRQAGFMDTLGWIYQKAGQTDSALEVFDNLTRREPRNPLYQYHLAVSLAQKGDRARARETLTAALALKPDGNLDSDIRQLLTKVN
jgi:tetratricopeptide (TPR) repeat protein